ncbi:OmpA family protein [Pelomonas sp. Root1217]|uniref:OmpA family protein n=1 Tax=Pelomonas sp. Root1217 TaxID=1736430 RepID=UPI000B2B0E48|nr:OmpA family protein [Pelomonas sp. Root1217]
MTTLPPNPIRAYRMTRPHFRRAALAGAAATACLVIGLPVNAAAAAADATCHADARGRFSDRCAADPRAVEIDGRDHLPASSERELPKLTVILGDPRGLKEQREETVRITPGQVQPHEESHRPLFDSGEDLLKPEDQARLDAIVAQVRGRQGLRFEIVGHTDVQRIKPELRPRFPDNHALGLARAHQVGRYLTRHLGLPESAYQAGSRGPDEPLAEPREDRANWAANRRVEVRVYWQETTPDRVEKEVRVTQLDPSACGMLSPYAADDAPLRLTIDGQAVVGTDSASADRQRCIDVRLERDRLRLQYDNLAQPRRLNATAWPATAVPGEMVRFAGYSNYRLFQARAELRLYSSDDAMRPQLVATVPLDAELRAQWTVPAEWAQTPLARRKLYWRVRVLDGEGRFDETDDIPLTLADRHAPGGNGDGSGEPTAEQRLLAAYGSTRLAVVNIPITGGTVTASGEGVSAGERVRALGLDVPVDAQGKFVLQQLVPRRVQTGEIVVSSADGKERIYRRDFELPKRDFFFVGQADLTLGHDRTSGPAALVTQERSRYNNDTWSEGRLAFYGKGLLDERWTLTGSLDTEERPLKELFRNLDRKDPTSLFRRIDPVDSWGTFGDDSTSIEDAPTQGRFYLRVDDGRSHALWGNFKLNLGSDNSLAQVNRGLYGLQGRFVGAESTSFGDARVRAEVYAAEPGTLAAREEFRGTGGSLYYLRHQDISRGAEKVWLEIRDRDSGLVMQRRALIPGSDYEVDYLQGRVLLTSPLASLADNGTLVRAGGLSGQPAYLVVDYEYTPLAGDLDTLAVGGRTAWWVNDGLRLGLTAAKQRQTGGDQRLASVDVLLRKSDNTTLKIEAARSDGPGIGSTTSLDGGFGFAQNTLAGDPRGANAWRVEGQADLADLDLAKSGHVGAYAMVREAGFSAPGQVAANETRQAGASATVPVGERTELRLKADHKDERNGYNTDAGDAQVAWRVDDRWTLSTGLRKDRKGTDAVNTSPLLPGSPVVNGERTDAAVQADYDSGQGWGVYGFGQKTLEHTGTRQDNDRLGVGARYRVNDKLSLRGEASGGDGGAAGKAGLDYQYNDRSNVYVTYALDTGRTDETLNARGGALVGGVKSRIADGLNVYTEHKQTTGAQSGLTHAYGVQYAPDERWTFGASAESGRIEAENAGETDREAVGFTIGFVNAKVKYSGGMEYRRDRSATDARRSWLLKNAVSVQDGPNARWMGKLNWADSDSATSALAAAKYTEAVLGYAFRPVSNDKLNLLLKYTYLYDLSSPGQVVATDVTPTSVSTLGIDYQQRSQVAAADVTYDLSHRWTVGGKLAWRGGELRPSRDSSAPWFKSSAQLAIVRVDWKVVRQYDWLVELRTLRAGELGERKSGLLTAGYYHVNENFKAGLGYNFTDFSDNLTDMSYRSRGVFVNLLGKF